MCSGIHHERTKKNRFEKDVTGFRFNFSLFPSNRNLKVEPVFRLTSPLFFLRLYFDSRASDTKRVSVCWFTPLLSHRNHSPRACLNQTKAPSDRPSVRTGSWLDGQPHGGWNFERKNPHTHTHPVLVTEKRGKRKDLSRACGPRVPRGRRMPVTNCFPSFFPFPLPALVPLAQLLWWHRNRKNCFSLGRFPPFGGASLRIRAALWWWRDSSLFFFFLVCLCGSVGGHHGR